MRLRGSVVWVVLLLLPLSGCFGAKDTPQGAPTPSPDGPTQPPTDLDGDGIPDPGPDDAPVPDNGANGTEPEPLSGVPEPHVVVAVPDSGINPYHRVYYRPNRTENPCTYLRDFPCLPALRLTLGTGMNYQQAVKADEAVWRNVTAGQWYWIPQTNIVAASCEVETAQRYGVCILNDPGESDGGHGTGTTSSVLAEEPDALIAFKEGGPDIGAFAHANIPVDVYSVSWGHVAPVGGLTAPVPVREETFGLYVKSAGNEPGPTTLADGWSGSPHVISVGGASAADRSQYLLASKDMDVVSYYCRPTASPGTTDQLNGNHCGTSFGGPTVAGALAKVILATRRSTGYDGGVSGGMVDPVAKLTVAGLRNAMNATASYDPAAEYPNTIAPSAPLNPATPYTQWGWGFYDGTVAKATIDVLLHGASPPAKPAGTAEYMAAEYRVREMAWS